MCSCVCTLAIAMAELGSSDRESIPQFRTLDLGVWVVAFVVRDSMALNS